MGSDENQISTILLVDDDRTQLNAWMRELRDRMAFPTTTRAEAIAIARQQPVDLAIVDLRLGEDHGFDVLRDLKRIDPSMIVVLASADMTATYGRLRCAKGPITRSTSPSARR